MYRAPVKPPQRSPGAPRPTGRFRSPGSNTGFHGGRSPYGGCGPRGGSPHGGSPYSLRSPGYSPGSHRGYWDGSPAGNGSRGFGGQMWGRSGGFRRPQYVSPGSGHNYQSRASDTPVEKYYSPSMLQDPWADLQNASGETRQDVNPDRK